MTRDALLLSPPLTRPPPRERRRVGEVAGGAAAECAAVCCCCPFSVMNLLILTVYKVPKGICRRALAHRRNKRRCLAAQKKALLQPRPNGLAGGGLYSDDDEFFRRASSYSDGDVDDRRGSEDESEGADLLEKEMWDRFDGAGFWRSASRRDL
ncbi:hypothetical protein D8674_034268 [Pyrus ussuriensis x Pyrus communis]|uniref:Uncharacterized protein n=1 Tax=Pyrus ussuriensis x Pyrus communis TaxID=2448454 RepID=A0A5N5HRY8_9ROSA|nr:uncharacterized protein LOC125475606 [Pyrus x bretschneideri]KAB2629473.1 hypothetical protein D8674_034268 [Pyrus ussuriensis x Pyrus communis]